ncbi:hypothetical protein P5673_000173 [Acropora cervicornis]|uniref:Uncharacterized protein n=1 Tax=Acropora cervicornis TaxID=6130 RepID=A0AAD9VHG3_ACRCE|nr:hypothetical protein P5673_000173 [Acropora cervicornis]
MAERWHRFIQLERLRVRTIGVLRKSTLQEVISHLKAIFARHGISETVITMVYGLQNFSAEFSKFAHARIGVLMLDE